MSDPVLAGDVLLYQLLVTNDGPSAATGVVLTDRVPISTTFVGASPPCIEVSGVVSCAIGTLDADDSASLWISVRVDEDAPDQSVIENTASISATTPDPDPSTTPPQWRRRWSSRCWGRLICPSPRAPIPIPSWRASC
jgi:uncharacterized repeat protein (TIGR01451 family)